MFILLYYKQTFRALCEERKEEYTAITQYKPKAAIAKEVLQVITERGGRFLKQVEHENEEDKPRTEDEEKYIQVNEKTALEKCKQVRPGKRRLTLPICSFILISLFCCRPYESRESQTKRSGKGRTEKLYLQWIWLMVQQQREDYLVQVLLVWLLCFQARRAALQ